MVIAHDVSVCVHSHDRARALDDEAKRQGARIRVHLKVDTGMGRAGFDWRDASSWSAKAREAHEAGVRWAGCYTHLHSADESAPSVHEQWARLEGVVARITAPPVGLMVRSGLSPARAAAGKIASPAVSRSSGGRVSPAR